jgi:hypothetical protein
LWFVGRIGASSAAYHVERHDIFERDLTGTVALHQELVDDLGAAASGQTQHERLFLGGVECLDTA